MPERIAVLDIGSSKIVTLVGEIVENGEIRVLGSGVVPARGIRKGVVVNVERAVECISESIAMASESSGMEVESVLVGITGEHIKGFKSNGMTKVSDRRNHVVREKDVLRALDQAKTVLIPEDSEILYCHKNTYILDKQRGVEDPIGMVALRLEVDVFLLMAKITFMRNLDMVLEMAKVEPIYYFFQPIAASYAVLSEEDMKHGVALVDIGKDTTDLAVWFEGELVHTAVLGIGGDLITSDIAYGLKIHKEKAEDLKLKYGVASSRVYSSLSSASEKARVKVPFDSEGEMNFDKRLFIEIIEARVEELIDFIRRELDRSMVADKLAMGVYLVGGTALMNGMRETIQRGLDLPTTIGVPKGLAGPQEFLRLPMYASAIGLLRVAPRLLEELEQEEGTKIRGLGDLVRYIGKAFRELFGGDL